MTTATLISQLKAANAKVAQFSRLMIESENQKYTDAYEIAVEQRDEIMAQLEALEA